MTIEVLKSKIHRVTVTEANLNYVGSVTIDEELLDEVGRRFERVVTVEDGVVRGGVGSAVRDFFDRRGYRTQVRSLGIPDDRFVEHGTPAELYAQCGFDEEGILRAILER